jgi:hypothetical protein
MVSCILSIPVIFFHYTVGCFFFTKILNIFKYNQKRRFYNLQFNVTIYKYKIRHKKYYVGKHNFSETRKFFILLVVVIQ